jgi:hypothetical protein
MIGYNVSGARENLMNRLERDISLIARKIIGKIK